MGKENKRREVRERNKGRRTEEVGKGRGGQRREEEMEGGRVKGRGKRSSLVQGRTSQRLVIPVGYPRMSAGRLQDGARASWCPHHDDGH